MLAILKLFRLFSAFDDMFLAIAKREFNLPSSEDLTREF